MPNHTPRDAQAQFDFTPQTKEIPLTQGKVAIVDAADYEWLMQWKWRLFDAPRSKTCYAIRNERLPSGKRTTVQMHCVILGTTAGVEVDHRDGNGLNNTRANLREATRSQNLWNRRLQKNNTSGYKGVLWHKGSRKWQARITINGIMKHIGLYMTAPEAARAFDAIARELHGEFARLNFPEEG